MRELYLDLDGFAGGNDTKKLIQLTHAIPKGAYIEAQVFHDDWCPRLKGTGKCACDPDIELKTDHDKPHEEKPR